MSLSAKLYSLTESLAYKIPPIFATPLRFTLYLANSIDANRWETARMMSTAFNNIMLDKVHGHYAEFGCFEGRATIEAYRSARRSGYNDTRFHIFDSFCGLPSGDEVFEQGEFACSREKFEGNLKRAGCDLSRFQIVEGFYNDTLPTAQTSDKFAVVWIDCDLYESTVPVLDFLTDKLVHGAVLCFDDWHCYMSNPNEGQQRAVKEWLERNPQITLRPYRGFSIKGESFIVNIEKAQP